jgi:hypothetical protein
MKLALNGKEKEYMIYSPEDHELVSGLTISYAKGYCITKINGKNMKFHRLLTNCPERMLVDHDNGNTLDNRRENLRITDYQGNAENRVKRKETSSKYKGVSFCKGNGKYRSKIKFKKRSIYLGCFENEEEAAEAYDIFIVHNNPSLFKLNFPDKLEQYKTQSSDFTEFNGVKKDGNMFTVNVKCEKRFETAHKAAKYRDEYIVEHNVKKQLNFPEEHQKFLRKRTKTEYKDVDEKTIRLIISSKPDAIVIIDREDYHNIKHYSFSIDDTQKRVKACRNSRSFLLHRLIMKETDPYVLIDHEDRNPLNNSRSNLRRSNPVKNSQNQSKSVNRTSKYVGVSFEKSCQQWRTTIFVEGKCHYVGRFNSEDEAAIARDLYILDNFPGSHYPLSGLDLKKEILNPTNPTKKKIPASKYKGVSLEKASKRWKAEVYQKYIRRKYIGRYDSEEKAAKERDAYILKHYPDLTEHLNF